MSAHIDQHEDHEGKTRLDVQSAVEIASDLLSRRFGGTPELCEVEHINGSGNGVVARAKLAPSAFLPYRSVVVKHMPYTDSELDDAAFLREVVAYQFTTSLPREVRPGPVLLAYDMDTRVLVLTDIGDAETLVDVLSRSSDEDRVKVLRLLGEQLGHMHAGTAAREADYDSLLARMLKKNPEFADMHAQRDRILLASIELGELILKAAGLTPPQEFGDLAQDALRIQQSGRGRAFTPFDLSPDNIVVGEQVYFLDYEWAGFRNVGFDVASVVAGFPQFLFSRPISDAEAEVFQSAWRREIIEAWPRYADDDKLHRLVVSCLIGWALSSITILYADSIEEVITLQEEGLGEDDPADFLRPAGQGPFSESETLVRQDLYETFEALSRYCASCDNGSYRVVAEFAQQVAQRLAKKQ